jgi:dimethylhistidine N-methyltransferase
MTPAHVASDADTTARFAADVREFLGRRPKQLPSRYFYDPLGSALFDAICELPWYRVTRAESRLLAAHASDIHRRLQPLSTIIELGPGNGEKLKLLLEAAPVRTRTTDVHLVDVSERALDVATRTLDAVPGIRIAAHAAPYDEGLREVSARSTGRRLVLFLGSNIGNFDAPCAAAFLDYVRENLAPGDALLLGTDLVKPEADLLLAYDDPLGVTAAFNRNLLVRINRELGGNFDLDAFAHQAVWNRAASRVEMHLVARSAQRVRIADVPLEVRFAEGERIWTESSHKYTPDGVVQMLERARFRKVEQWIDRRDAFALTLALADNR